MCDQMIDDDSIICAECEQQLSYLQRKCIDSLKMRTQDVENTKTSNNYLCNSPSLLCHRVNRLTQNAKRQVIKRIKTKSKEVLKHITERDGII